MLGRVLAGGLLGALLVSCGGSGEEPTPTSTATAIRTPVPTATPFPASTPPPHVHPSATPAPTTVVVPKPSCLDPYPQGAPYQPDPGEPILIRPAASPQALGPFQPSNLTDTPELQRIVRETLGEDASRFAVVVKNLSDGRGMRLAPNRTFPAASLFKTWVMLEVFHHREAGMLSFDERWIVSNHYASLGLGADQFQACDEVTVDRAMRRMMQVSDNVAANLLADRVGVWNINASLDGLGLRVAGYEGEGRLPVSAADMALLLEAIARRQAVSEAASGEMLTLLTSETFSDRLPALLPQEARVAHKTGNWSNATHDAGIVFSPNATYVIVVLNDFGFDEDGATPIARLSRAVYDYFNSP